MFKVYTASQNGVRVVKEPYDLNWDPDQSIKNPNRNLLAGGNDPDYLGEAPIGGCGAGATGDSSLNHTMNCCLDEFWDLDADKGWAPQDRGCSPELREWPDP